MTELTSEEIKQILNGLSQIEEDRDGIFTMLGVIGSQIDMLFGEAGLDKLERIRAVLQVESTYESYVREIREILAE